MAVTIDNELFSKIKQVISFQAGMFLGGWDSVLRDDCPIDGRTETLSEAVIEIHNSLEKIPS